MKVLLFLQNKFTFQMILKFFSNIKGENIKHICNVHIWNIFILLILHQQGGAQSSICPEQETILEILRWEIFVGTRDEIFVQSRKEIFVGSRNPRSGGLIKAQQKTKIPFNPKCREPINLKTFYNWKYWILHCLFKIRWFTKEKFWSSLISLVE